MTVVYGGDDQRGAGVPGRRDAELQGRVVGAVWVEATHDRSAHDTGSYATDRRGVMKDSTSDRTITEAATKSSLDRTGD